MTMSGIYGRPTCSSVSGLAASTPDISRDDDHYLALKLKEVGFPSWNDVTAVPCQTPMPATKKLVLQYPPGTGMVLALFPPGYQVIPLYVTATLIVFGFALFGIISARSVASVLLAGAFGCLAVYLMINPSKASYSMAPTMVACAAAGYLTARLFTATPRHRLWLTILLGLLLGVSVDFRLPNLFLSSGYFLFFLFSFLSSRKMPIVVHGAAFAVDFLIGTAPTLLANVINAGSPFATTYGGQAGFSFGIVRQYVADMQIVLLVLAGASTAFMLRTRGDNGVRRVALVTAANLALNLAFFLSHPVFTPYYTIPIAMLSLWSLLFGSLMQPSTEVAERSDLAVIS
jgi:hypothetical protein